MQRFASYEEAAAAAAAMAGWTIRILQSEDPGDLYWVLQCNGTHYLCADGYIR